MGAYRRLGDLEDRQAIDAFAAEIIDRFGTLPEEPPTYQDRRGEASCPKAFVAKLDIRAKGAFVTFADSGFPDLGALLGYIERMKGVAKLRPDSKMTIPGWPTAEARLTGALQLSRGLARVAAAANISAAAPGAARLHLAVRPRTELDPLLLVEA